MTYDEAIAFLKNQSTAESSSAETPEQPAQTGVSQADMLSEIAGHYTASYVSMGATDLFSVDIDGEQLTTTSLGRMTGNKNTSTCTITELTDKEDNVYAFKLVGDDILDGAVFFYYPAGKPVSEVRKEDMEMINRLDGEDPTDVLDAAYIVSAKSGAYRKES